TVSEDGKGKKTVLKKDAVSSIFSGLRSNVKVSENHQHELRQGRPRALSMLGEFFLTPVRLKHAFAEEHPAYHFKICRATLSKMFLSWINLLFFELGSIPI
ncbi:unnamed protein product, partial [Porites lobata]